MRVRVTTDPLDPPLLIAEVSAARNGAVVSFLGTVREINEGRTVTGLEYSVYDTMARRELHTIVSEACQRYDTTDIVAEHRVGTLDMGETSVVIVAAHPHRGQAFDACRFVLEELKRRVPIWKRELYTDGTREWVDPTRNTSADTSTSISANTTTQTVEAC